MSGDIVEESQKEESQLAKTASPSPCPLLINGKKDKFSCPKSQEKLDTTKSKSFRQDLITLNPQSPIFSGSQQIEDLAQDGLEGQEAKVEKPVPNGTQQTPPPCIRNPYLSDASDPFGNQRFKCAGLSSSVAGGAGPLRFHTDFVEIEQIGTGHFGHVYKVLNRIDGCLYAVKQVTRPMCQDLERRKALLEVQSLAALGSHENIVGYYSSWFGNEHLYIQMELCDSNLSCQKSSCFTECDALTFLHQLAKVLLFMHDRGIAHLDVKPDNIYFKNGVYKLGDFGCATLLNKSLPIQEGDTRNRVDFDEIGASVSES